MNRSNYISAGNTIFGNYGITRSYISPQQRKYRNILQEYQRSHIPAGLNAENIILDEAIINFETLREICGEITGQKKRESYIMPTKTDLIEFLEREEQ